MTRKFLLDANVVSELRRQRPHAGVVAWLQSLDDAQLHLSAVTLGEIQAGIELTREPALGLLVGRRLSPLTHGMLGYAAWGTGSRSSVMGILGSAGAFLAFALWFGPGGNFLIQATAYALIALTTVRIVWPAVKADSKGSASLRNLGDGLRYIAREPGTRPIVLRGPLTPVG